MCKLIAAAALLLGLAISAAQAEELAYLYDVVTKPAYKHSLDTIVAGQPVESWVRDVLSGEGGLGTPGKIVSAGPANYELYDVCQPHNCGGNFFYVLFTRGGGQAWAVMTTDDRIVRYYGSPNAAQQKLLSDATSR
jgi:hypothetical protein